MNLVSASEYQQYQVPRADGASLVQPSRQQLLSVLAAKDAATDANFDHSRQRQAIEFCGKSLDIVREQARLEAFEQAIHYTRSYRDVGELPSQSAGQAATLILSGHQPELFHAGVWFKNFLLSNLAAQTGAIGINFLVDNDLCRTPSIRVPALDRAAQPGPDRRSCTGGVGDHPNVVAQSVLFDAPRDVIPWELRRLGSLDVWQKFPRAVQQTLLPGARTPLLMDAWPDAIEAVKRTDRPGLAIAQMRHRLEQRIGLQTLEVPLSQLVSTRGFARFSIQLFSQLPRFQETYNSQLEHYREAHRIRSHAHPVPALEQQDGWLEAPWWVYRADAPHRQPLWVRLLDDRLILSNRGNWQVTIEGRLDCDNASSQWLELVEQGICLRPRALVTTMYLRLMVSDLFLHGIGGGKYDQLTDAIVREFFGIEPTPMAVATATLHLPLGNRFPAETGHEIADLDSRRIAEREHLWQLKYHAEQRVPALAAAASDRNAQPQSIQPTVAELSADVAHSTTHSGEFQQLAERKRELLANIPPRGEKWRWHREITRVNRRLSELTEELAQQSRERLKCIAMEERQQRILQSRETSFCLFPLDEIAPRLQAMAEA